MKLSYRVAEFANDHPFSFLGLMGLVFGTVICVLVYYSGEISCRNAWGDSGMKSRWSWSTSCQVQLPDGNWIPASNFRRM